MQEKEEKSNIKRICIGVVHKKMFKAIEHRNTSEKKRKGPQRGGKRKNKKKGKK